MLPFQFVLPGWAGSQWWKAWRWRAIDAASPGLSRFVLWGLCPQPALAPRGMSFGVPTLRSRRPTWYLPDSPRMLSPQYFSTCSLMYLTLFLRSAKYTASHRLQQANHRTQTKENSFLISLTRHKQHLRHFPNLNVRFSYQPLHKKPNHPLQHTLVKLRCSTAHLSALRASITPLGHPEPGDQPLAPLVNQGVAAKNFFNCWMCFLALCSGFTADVRAESYFWWILQHCGIFLMLSTRSAPTALVHHWPCAPSAGELLSFQFKRTNPLYPLINLEEVILAFKYLFF